MKKFLMKLMTLGITIFVFMTSVKVSAASTDYKLGVVSTYSSRLIVRKAASGSSDFVTSLPKGGYITLISKTGEWWYVEYAKNKYGYCYSDYISVTDKSAYTVNVSYGGLNVRKGSGTHTEIIDSLKKGDTVFVLSTSNGWSKIVYAGTNIGYVSSSYLTYNSGYKKAALGVPDYKQNDSRWANVKVAASGKTISQIGCATTAIAMIESYRQNKMLTPDVMIGQLSYTSSGNVYWPSHYTAVTDSENYLIKIYNQLSLGKPVLLGAKNSSGKQHWVVVIGYTGKSVMSAVEFTINDPGSKTRTNLAQFLNVYPIFYKYFHY